MNSIMMPSYTESSSRLLLVKGTFQSVNRFGHATDFSLLFSKDKDEFADYLIGVLTLSLVFSSLFLLWGFILICFKCPCLQVGFLSGAPFRATRTRSTMAVVPNPWISRGRWVFGISLTMVIVFAIVFVAAGIGNLTKTTTTIGSGVSLTSNILSASQVLLQSLLVTVEVIARVKNDLVQELQAFRQALEQAESVADVDAAVSSLLAGLQGLDDLATDLLQQVVSVLQEGQRTLDNIYTVTTKVDLRGFQAALGIGLTILPALLLGCLYWNVRYNDGRSNGRKPKRFVTGCRAYFLWPLFLLMTVVLIIGTFGICVAGLLNADFCSGGEDRSPDSTILEILQQVGYPPKSLEYQAAQYFVSECQAIDNRDEPPFFEEITTLQNNLHNNTLLEEISATKGQIARAGGWGALGDRIDYNTTIIQNRMAELVPSLGDVALRLTGFLASLPCQPIYNVYFTVTHQAACDNSYTGTFWMFFGLVGMSFFGLLAITFRSALYPIEDYNNLLRLGQDHEDDDFMDERAALTAAAAEEEEEEERSSEVAATKALANIYLFSGFGFLTLALGFAIAAIALRDKGRT